MLHRKQSSSVNEQKSFSGHTIALDHISVSACESDIVTQTLSLVKLLLKYTIEAGQLTSPNIFMNCTTQEIVSDDESKS